MDLGETVGKILIFCNVPQHHLVRSPRNWGGSWDKIYDELYIPVRWNTWQFFWKDIRKVTDYRDIFKVWKRAGIKRIELALCNSSGDSYYIARWVCELNRPGVTINLGIMSFHPVHTQDDVNI